MTVGEASDINTVLKALAHVDGVSWEAMEKAGRELAKRAHKVLYAGYDAESFSRALAAGQGFRKTGPSRKRPGAPRL